MEINAELESYIEQHTEAEPEVLKALVRATHQQMLRPRMLSGNLQGQFLKMLCRLVGARRVLEIGTYTGYAAISMAMGLEDGGVVHTVDVNDELEDFTREYIRQTFGTLDRDELLAGIPDEVQARILRGEVVPGMNQAQVLLAYGPPPAIRTPQLTNESWIYWIGESRTIRVIFRGDQVRSILNLDNE